MARPGEIRLEAAQLVVEKGDARVPSTAMPAWPLASSKRVTCGAGEGMPRTLAPSIPPGWIIRIQILWLFPLKAKAEKPNDVEVVLPIRTGLAFSGAYIDPPDQMPDGN